MLRQLRALFRTESPLPDFVHFHLDEHGHEYLCDESICRPARATQPVEHLLGLAR